MSGYMQCGGWIYRTEGRYLRPVGEASTLRRHVRSASRRLDGTGDLDALVAELQRWASEDAPNDGGRRNALAAAAWLDGTGITVRGVDREADR